MRDGGPEAILPFSPVRRNETVSLLFYWFKEGFLLVWRDLKPLYWKINWYQKKTTLALYLSALYFFSLALRKTSLSTMEPFASTSMYPISAGAPSLTIAAGQQGYWIAKNKDRKPFFTFACHVDTLALDLKRKKNSVQEWGGSLLLVNLMVMNGCGKNGAFSCLKIKMLEISRAAHVQNMQDLVCERSKTLKNTFPKRTITKTSNQKDHLYCFIRTECSSLQSWKREDAKGSKRWYKEKKKLAKWLLSVIGTICSTPRNNTKPWFDEFQSLQKDFCSHHNVWSRINFTLLLRGCWVLTRSPRVKFGTIMTRVAQVHSENAFAYLHGHEGGGTRKPFSLLKL